jgi:hypothetical protein
VRRWKNQSISSKAKFYLGDDQVSMKHIEELINNNRCTKLDHCLTKSNINHKDCQRTGTPKACDSSRPPCDFLEMTCDDQSQLAEVKKTTNWTALGDRYRDTSLFLCRQFESGTLLPNDDACKLRKSVKQMQL